jgi:hypothetical protein
MRLTIAAISSSARTSEQIELSILAIFYALLVRWAGGFARLKLAAMTIINFRKKSWRVTLFHSSLKRLSALEAQLRQRQFSAW